MASSSAPNTTAAATSNMEIFRKFELTLFSADDLPDVRNLFKMKAYARVSIGGKRETKTQREKTEQRTPVDKEGGRNPCWNHKMVYAAKEATILNEDTLLSIRLYCERAVKPDKYVGQMDDLRLKELFDHQSRSSSAVRRKYDLYKYKKHGYKDARGTLEMSCAFGEPILVDEEEQVSAENADDQVRPGMVKLKKAGQVVLVGIQVALGIGMLILQAVQF